MPTPPHFCINQVDVQITKCGSLTHWSSCNHTIPLCHIFLNPWRGRFAGRVGSRHSCGTTLRAAALPKSIGSREKVSLSAVTILAAGVPIPAHSLRRSLRRYSVVMAAQDCIAPVLHSYLQTDYVLFKVQNSFLYIPR